MACPPPHHARFWQTNYDTLTSSLGLSKEAAVGLIRRHPGMLHTDPVALHHQCSMLSTLLTSHGPWLQQLEHGTPEQLQK